MDIKIEAPVMQTIAPTAHEGAFTVIYNSFLMLSHGGSVSQTLNTSILSNKQDRTIGDKLSPQHVNLD